MGSLFWTLILLLLLFYSFGVLITETVIEHCRYLDGDGDSMPVCPKELGKWTSVTIIYFHFIPLSMLTLFIFAAAILILYVVITFFAILHLGIDLGPSNASPLWIAKNHQVKALRDIFKEIDQDDSNEVSVDELQEAISKGRNRGPLAKMSFENKLTRRAIANLSQDIQELKDALLDPPTEIEDF
eukprot:g4345.t1